MKTSSVPFFVRLLLTALTVLLLALELLPYGAVLRFARPPEEGGTIRQTYSYFDLTPWGYANFSPLLTAFLSVVLLILTVIAVWNARTKLFSAIATVSLAGAVLSQLPALSGLYSPVAGGVTACLLTISVIAFWGVRRQKTASPTA